MRLRYALPLALFGCAALGLLHAATKGNNPLFPSEKEWAEYPGQDNAPIPPDYKEVHEWVWARLRYSGFGRGGGGFGGGRRGGGFGGYGSWAIDYSKSDRTLVSGIKRLTLLDTRSVEQTVDMDGSDDPYNWPFLYAVEVGRWDLSEQEAKQIRDFLNRGGFLMVDDFHCDDEWAVFMESFERVFPDREVIDIPDNDPVNTAVFDLPRRQQIPGMQYMNSGSMNECFRGGRADPQPHYRTVYDDKQRLMVAIVHNSDLGDAIEFADSPRYPEEFAQAAFRVLSNYVIYDLTH
jgi:hypothetical protein